MVAVGPSNEAETALTCSVYRTPAVRPLRCKHGGVEALWWIRTKQRGQANAVELETSGGSQTPGDAEVREAGGGEETTKEYVENESDT